MNEYTYEQFLVASSFRRSLDISEETSYIIVKAGMYEDVSDVFIEEIGDEDIISIEEVEL